MSTPSIHPANVGVSCVPMRATWLSVGALGVRAPGLELRQEHPPDPVARQRFVDFLGNGAQVLADDLALVAGATPG